MFLKICRLAFEKTCITLQTEQVIFRNICMQQLMKDEAMNLEESGKKLFGKFGGRKGKGEIVIL